MLGGTRVEHLQRRMTATWLVLAALSATLSIAALAAAQAPPVDTVDLKDGTQVKGEVIKQEPGKFVVVKLPDGSQQVLSWDDIKRVTTAPRAQPQPGTVSPPPVAPPVAPAPTTTTDLQKDGVKITQESDCAAGERGVECREKRSLQAGAGGIGLGVSTQRVTAVKEPPNSSFNFGIQGGFMYGTKLKGDGPSFSIYGGGAEVSIKGLIGPDKFPGPSGGSWSGAFINPGVGFYGAGMIWTVNDKTDGAGMVMTNVGVSAGYQFLKFKEMVSTTLQQSGWGLGGGIRAAWQNTKVMQSTTVTSNDFSWGPVFELTFPDYNAGTAHLARGFFNIMVLPTGDFLFVTISGGGAI